MIAGTAPGRERDERRECEEYKGEGLDKYSCGHFYFSVHFPRFLTFLFKHNLGHLSFI